MSFNSLLGLGIHTGENTLLGFWPLQETSGTGAFDYSSYSYNGHLVGGGSTHVTGSGPNNWLTTAFDFDGTGKYISIPRWACNVSSDPRTIGGWVYPNLQNTNTQSIVNFGEGTNGRNFSPLAGGQDIFSFGGGKISTSDNPGIPTSEWTFFTAHVPTGATGVRNILVEKNCVVFPNLSYSNNWPLQTTRPTNVEIGANTDNSDYFNGKLAGWFSFSRNLTSGEITEIYSGPEPINYEAPSLNGNQIVGSTLTCDHGTWGLGVPFSGRANGTITYQYQWYSNNEVLPGETGSTYIVQESDVGSSIKVLISAYNDGGNDSSADTFSLSVTGQAAHQHIYRLNMNIYTT